MKKSIIIIVINVIFGISYNFYLNLHHRYIPKDFENTYKLSYKNYILNPTPSICVEIFNENIHDLFIITDKRENLTDYINCYFLKENYIIEIQKK